MATQEIQNEEVELNEALITKQSYPILWIGENGYNITRYAKLIRVKPSYFKDREEMQLIIPVAVGTKYIVFVPDKWYIIAGGVDPKLVFVRDIVYIYRGEEETIKAIIKDLILPVDTQYEFASGIKSKTYAVIYERIYSTDMFEPLRLDEGKSIIAKLYPETFKIFAKEDKLFIEYLQPEDC